MIPIVSDVKPAFVRMRAVTAIVGLSRSEIYRRIAAGTFPGPIRLGGKRSMGYLLHDIERWVAERVAESRKAA